MANCYSTLCTCTWGKSLSASFMWRWSSYSHVNVWLHARVGVCPTDLRVTYSYLLAYMWSCTYTPVTLLPSLDLTPLPSLLLPFLSLLSSHSLPSLSLLSLSLPFSSSLPSPLSDSLSLPSPSSHSLPLPLTPFPFLSLPSPSSHSLPLPLTPFPSLSSLPLPLTPFPSLSLPSTPSHSLLLHLTFLVLSSPWMTVFCNLLCDSHRQPRHHRHGNSSGSYSECPR